MTLLPLISSPLTYLLRAWRRNADRPAVFEHVDSKLLECDTFGVSDSMGLDGAPSMAFLDAMPPYSHAIDRPSVRRGASPFPTSNTNRGDVP